MYFEPAHNYGLCHPLDRPTEGLLIVGRSSRSRAHFRFLIQPRKVRKLYWVVIQEGRDLQDAEVTSYSDRSGDIRTNVKVAGETSVGTVAENRADSWRCSALDS